MRSGAGEVVDEARRHDTRTVRVALGSGDPGVGRDQVVTWSGVHRSVPQPGPDMLDLDVPGVDRGPVGGHDATSMVGASGWSGWRAKNASRVSGKVTGVPL